MAQVFEAIHKDSCMCGKSELDLFTVPATQVEMNKGFWEDVDPCQALGVQTILNFSLLQILMSIPIWQTVIFI